MTDEHQTDQQLSHSTSWPDPAEYVGSPDDMVKARRRAGFGWALIRESEFDQNIPLCECHPGEYGVVHEGDIVYMRRSEVQGYWREEDGVWNAGRVDFEVVPDETPMPPVTRRKGQREEPAPVHIAPEEKVQALG